MTAFLRMLLAAAVLASAQAAPADDGMSGSTLRVLSEAKARLAKLNESIALAPAEFRELREVTAKSAMSGNGVRSFTYLMILLLVGVGVEWLYWIYAYASWRALHSTPAPAPGEALRLGMRRLVLAGFGLLLFTATTIGASAAFTWPAGVHEVLIAAVLLLGVLRLAWLLIATLLAPGRAGLRLVPVPPERVGRLAATLMGAVCLLALGRFVPEVVERVGGAPHVAGVLRFATFSLTVLFVVLAARFLFKRVRLERRHGAQPAQPRFPREFVIAAMAVAVYAVWLVNDMAAAAAAILAIVIALQLGLRDMVFYYWTEPDPGPLPSIVLSAGRFVIVLAGLGVCALVLKGPLLDMAPPESPIANLIFRVLGVATLCLLAHVVWIAVRTTIDHRLTQIRPAPGHHDGPTENSRLLTLLPLLRMAAAILLLVMLVLSALWTLGIEITPLLAGAGVVGLALGFGAQALVRDVIAGVFYLAEDAFRVGEYIEGGANIKGTVERITLRTVALRHHNGPLHFVPYGSLGTVRNTSRDWVIDKFNLPLPIGVESEKIRKMIKKVGEEMKANPELGPMLMMPLKGKLYRIDPGVKVFRCKFQSPPGKQFDLRAAALKRIEAELKKMGVGFADGTQTVLLAPAADAVLGKAVPPAAAA